MPNPSRFSPIGTRLVEMLVFPSVQVLDATGPIQVFSSANDFAVESGNPPAYDLRVVTQDAESVTSSAGVGLATVPLSPIGSPVATLMIAGGPGVQAAAANP